MRTDILFLITLVSIFDSIFYYLDILSATEAIQETPFTINLKQFIPNHKSNNRNSEKKETF